MKQVGTVARVKGRPYLSIAISLTALLLVWYLSTLFLGKFYLSATSYDTLPTDEWSDEHRIILDDSLLSTVTPELRQLLINAPDITAITEPEQQQEEPNEVLLSSLEIDQVNKMLASTEMGKQLIAEGWDNDFKRGDLLFPDPSSEVMVGYNGVAYTLAIGPSPFAFPFDPTNYDLGWGWTFFQVMFFGIMIGSAIVLGQTIQGVRRKEFVGTRVDAAILISIFCIVSFVVSLWYFIVLPVLMWID